MAFYLKHRHRGLAVLGRSYKSCKLTIPVGAQEQRDSAMAFYLTHRYRGLAVLGRSYSMPQNHRQSPIL